MIWTDAADRGISHSTGCKVADVGRGGLAVKENLAHDLACTWAVADAPAANTSKHAMSLVYFDSADGEIGAYVWPAAT